MTQHTRRLSARRSILMALSALIAVLLIAFLIPAAAHTTWPRLLQELASAPPLWVALLAAAAITALLLDTVSLRRAFAPAPFQRVLAANAEGHAIALGVPLGGTLAAGWMLARLRDALSDRQGLWAGAALALTGDITAAVLVPALGAVALALSPEVSGTLQYALLAAAVLAVSVGGAAARLVASESALRALLVQVQSAEAAFSDGFGRPSRPLVEPVMQTRSRALTAARSGLPLIIGTPVLARLVQAAVFAALCSIGLGMDVSVPALVGVAALGRLLTLVPLTPAGVGVVDAAMTAALVTLGAQPVTAGAAVLLFTLTQTVLPALIGSLSLAVTTARGRAR